MVWAACETRNSSMNQAVHRSATGSGGADTLRGWVKQACIDAGGDGRDLDQSGVQKIGRAGVENRSNRDLVGGLEFLLRGSSTRDSVVMRSSTTTGTGSGSRRSVVLFCAWRADRP